MLRAEVKGTMGGGAVPSVRCFFNIRGGFLICLRSLLWVVFTASRSKHAIVCFENAEFATGGIYFHQRMAPAWVEAPSRRSCPPRVHLKRRAGKVWEFRSIFIHSSQFRVSMSSTTWVGAVPQPLPLFAARANGVCRSKRLAGY